MRITLTVAQAKQLEQRSMNKQIAELAFQSYLSGILDAHDVKNATGFELHTEGKAPYLEVTTQTEEKGK